MMDASESLIVIPDSVRKMAEESVGAFFENISKAPKQASARDHLDVKTAIKNGQILERYTSVRGKKLLEIGSGYGVNLAAWTKIYNVDGYGTERDAEGFGNSFRISQDILKANDLDPKRIIDVSGNELPFADASFDIVYARNVLEHTEDPVQVLHEAIRVLRPGGIFHTEIPNYLSYFEGHYLIPQPPLIFKWILPIWVRLLGRDPAYAGTMRTEINPIWCRKAVKRANAEYPVDLISVGSEVFLERLRSPFKFDMERTSEKLGRIIRILQAINLGNCFGRLIVLCQGHYPIYLTVRRK
jgi:ubiquinone/menaquinone biosynthesis C-methylase UbiE